MRVGTELFPQIDSGEFVLRFRPPPGSNFEVTRQMAVKCLEEIERQAKPENIEISMGYVGQVAPNFGINNMVLFMRGPDDGQLRVAFREGSGIKLAEFRERLRKVLPERVVPWLAQRLEQGGLTRSEAQKQSLTATFGFQPGDIVTVPVDRLIFVYVDGAVKTPGRLEEVASRPITLGQAIAKAGGATERANLKSIQVLRKGKDGETITLTANLTRIRKGKEPDHVLQDGDVVVIPETFF